MAILERQSPVGSGETTNSALTGSGPLVPGTAFDQQQLPHCCERTVLAHAKHNEMMVCNDCKQIIKCFKEDRPLRAYLKFCETRHRKVVTSMLGEYRVVTFASYEPFVR